MTVHGQWQARIHVFRIAEHTTTQSGIPVVGKKPTGRSHRTSAQRSHHLGDVIPNLELHVKSTRTHTTHFESEDKIERNVS